MFALCMAVLCRPVDAASAQVNGGQAGTPSTASGGVPASPVTVKVSFQFERAAAGVAVPRYTIELRGDGSGAYHAALPVAQSSDFQHTERPLVFGAETVLTVLAAMEAVHASGMACASHAKNIADTGTKTLSYRRAGSDEVCTYNYSENKAVIQLTTFFEGVENTLEEGRALDFKHRFDRLGLDAEIAALGTAADEGRALELVNIASTLRSIAEDTELIQRVRLRAAKLLEHAQPGG